MASADVQGKFLWHELMTHDPGAAGAFYGKVLGWTPQAWDKDPSYTVLLTPKGPVGGMMKPGPEAQSGSTARWLAYVGTSHVEETIAAAQRLGGRIVKGATDIPGGGRYAILADPQGAVLGIHAPPASGAGDHAAEAFTWHELATSDHVAALRFYRELFGWEQLGVHDMGAMGPYVLFGRAGQQLGGMFTRSGGPAPHWLAYVRVSSASRTADAAKAAGGRVLNGPQQVPGGSWIAQLADPQGAAIAVNQPQAAGETAQPSKPAAPPRPAAAPATAPKPVVVKPAAPTTPTAAVASAERPAATAGRSPVAPAAGAGRAPPARTAPAGTAPAGKSAGRKPAARKSAARKSTARKSSARKAAGRSGAGRATARSARKAPSRSKSAPRKRPAKKKGAAARSAPGGARARKTARAKSGRRKSAKKRARR